MQKYMLMLVMVLFVVGAANAADTTWDPANNGIVPPAVGNWGDPNNWTLNAVPTDADKVKFSNADAAECQVTDAQVVGTNMVQADGGPGGVLRIMDGGTLTQVNSSWWGGGYNNTSTLIVERGGLVDFRGHCWWGMHTGADSVVEINGGTIYNEQSFGLGEWFGGSGNHGTCKVYINDGELNIDHWTGAIGSDHPVFWNDSLIDVKLGKMIIRETVTVAEAQAYVDAGKITGYGGSSDVIISDASGDLVITAVDPMDPSPVHNAELIAPPGGTLDVTMTWTNKDPCTPGVDPVVDVWFGSDTDPNVAAGGHFIKVDASGSGTASWEETGLTAGDYYWQVMLVGSNNSDPNYLIHHFSITDDSAPTVVITSPAKPGMLTWAEEEMVIEAMIDDDSASAVTVVWSSSADPNVTFDPPTETFAAGTEYPVYVSTIAVGDSHQPYTTITVTVSDGSTTDADSDTVVLDIARDPCHAAGGGHPHLYDVYTADFDQDCIVNLRDFSDLAEGWMDNYALQAPVDK